MLLVIIFGLILCYVCIVIKLSQGLKRLNKCDDSYHFFISIIVAARNEQNTISHCLNALLSQDCPEHLIEIICVDDHSEDATYSIMKKYEDQFSQLKIIRLTANELRSKKSALAKAIRAAKGEILLFTDADCEPPPTWAKDMTACFQPDVGMVVGYSPLIDKTNSLVGRLIKFDSFVAATIAAAGIGLNYPVTCTGRNIAYRKQVFHDVGGFSEIIRSISGDDDLFLQQVHKKTSWNIRYNISSLSFVKSYQTKTLKEFLFQKRRHISAGKYYPKKLQLIYAFIHGANFTVYMLLLYSIFSLNHFWLAAGILLAKILTELYFITSGARLLNIQLSIKYFLLWNLFYTVYNMLAGPAAFIGKIKWRK